MYRIFKKLSALICANVFIFMSFSVYAAPFEAEGDISIERSEERRVGKECYS